MGIIRIYIFLLVATIFSFVVSDMNAQQSEQSKQVVELLKELEDDPENVELVIKVAKYYFRSDDFATAYKHGKKLLEIAEKTGDRENAKLYGHFFIGSTGVHYGNPSDAFRHLEMARSIGESTHNYNALVSIYNSLGLHYLFVHNDALTASSYYYQALEQAKQTGDKKSAAAIMSNLAAAYLTLEDASGLLLAEQAVEYCDKSGYDASIKARLILADFYILADSVGKAQSTLEFIRENESRELVEYFSDYMDFIHGKLEEKKGNFQEAEKIFRKLYENLGDDEDPSSVSTLSNSLAHVLRANKKYHEAISILEKGIANANKMARRIHMPAMLKELALVYNEAGMPEKAFKTEVRLEAIKDSLNNLGRQRVLQENRVRHEVFVQEKQIEEQKAQLSSERQKKTLLIVVILALIIICIVTWINNRKKNRLYKAIVVQNTDFINREQQLRNQIEKLTKPSETSEETQNANEWVSEKHESPDEAALGGRLSKSALNDIASKFFQFLEQENGFTDSTLTVASAAERIGTNRTYLSKAINETTDKNFLQVVNDYRIRMALEMISDIKADYPLKQIASETGFNSISTFYSAFQTTTGMTPARYRAKLREI